MAYKMESLWHCLEHLQEMIKLNGKPVLELTRQYEFGNQVFDYYSKWDSCANTCKLELGIKPCDGIPVVELIWQQAML